MEFVREPEYVAWRNELRAFIREWRMPDLLQEYEETYSGGGRLIAAFHQEIDRI
jgi:hypothetical protein